MPDTPPAAPETEVFASAILDTLDSRVVVLDGVGRILATNAAWERAAREGGATGAGIGADYFATCEGVDDASAAATLTGLWAIASGEDRTFVLDYPCPTPEQSQWFRLTATRYVGPGSARIVVRHDDITTEKLAWDASHLRAQLLDAVDVAVVATDLDGHVEVWNDTAEQLYGWSAEEAVGCDLLELTIPVDRRAEARAALHELAETGAIEGELDILHRSGSTLAVHVRDRVMHDADGSPSGVVSVAVDISQRIAAERRLTRDNAWLRAVTERMGDGLCTLDARGHIAYVNPAGERLLGAPASAAIAGSFVNRLLGTRADGSRRPLSEQLIGADFAGHVAAEVTEDRLLRADGSLLPVEYVATALPAADTGCPSGWVVVFRDITARVEEQERLRSDAANARWMARIQEALDHDRFVLHAQPVIDLATGRACHHELLLRLDDPDEGLIAPGEFLPTAEAFGLAPAIDRWVIAHGIALAATGVPVQINLSARSLSDPSLPYVIEQLLRETGTRPQDVVFEITETALLDDDEQVAHFARRIRAIGCLLALDDFGTGYGTFTYLKNLPVDVLKLDMAFVRDAVTDPASRHVITTVVALAKAFGALTIAEGIEDEATLQLMIALGVDRAQGFHLGRPAALPAPPPPETGEVSGSV